MHGFDTLLACAGIWQGANRVQPYPSEPADESPTQMIVTPLLRDTFVRFDQTWSWKGEPQEGSMLIGYNPRIEQASVHWIDTWHNGRKVMPLVGRFEPDGSLIVNGHFAVENSPDYGWRILIRATGAQLKIEMTCLTPTGEPEGGVWTDLVRG